MRSRTLCMDCMRTGHPDTVLEGSDLIEIVGWLCLLAPGWLYCAWRHLMRAKICGFCGSGALIRESRSVAARRSGDAESQAAVAIHSRRGLARWPRAIAEPRVRLRGGVSGAGLGTAAFVGWVLAILVPTPWMLHSASVATGLALAWQLATSVWVLRRHVVTSDCRAWTLDGRQLRIEVL